MSNRSPERTEFLTDILITAVEGGIGYWSVGDGSTYEWEGPAEGRGFTILEWADEDPGVDGVSLPIRITLDDVARGVDVVVRGESGVADSYVSLVANANRLNDSCPDHGGDIDADVADVIVQAAVFGDVIFG